MAVPFMLIVAPRGTTNCATLSRTFRFSTAVLIDIGMTAAELDVLNASSRRSRDSRTNCNGFCPAVMRTKTRYRIIISKSPASTVAT